MGMVITVVVLIGLALLGGPVGVAIAAGVLVLGGLISALQPMLSRSNRADNWLAAGQLSTNPGPYCPCAECQGTLWTPTGGADSEWVVMDSPRDGQKTRQLSAASAPAAKAGGSKTQRFAQQGNGHPVGCGCLDCGDLRAGKSSRWA